MARRAATLPHRSRIISANTPMPPRHPNPRRLPMRQAILLSACLLLPGTLAAQAQQPLVGSWAVTVPAGMRMENGVATPMQATGALTVRVEGDSLIGTLKMEPIEDAPDRPATRLTAKFAAGAVVFISH